MIAAKKIAIGICGGGPGGGTLALCLGKLGGFQVTVLEKRSDLEGGYKIDFRGKAIKAFQQMNIYEMIRKIRTHYKEATVTLGNSSSIKIDSDASGARIGDDLEVMRGVFCRALYTAAKQTGNVAFKFNQSIQSISERSDGVHVTFENGKKCTFDLLVGADGLHSQVRNLVFEQSQLECKHALGVSLCYVHLPESFLSNDQEEVQLIGLGKFVEVFNIPKRGTIAAFAFPSTSMKGCDHRDIESIKKFLLREYGGEDIRWALMPQLLKAIQKASDECFHFSEATQIRMPKWSKGRVVLIGDAAACPSPLTGQGGSFAVLSGYILARELYKTQGNHEIAFPAYQQALDLFVQENQKLADVNVEMIKDSTSIKARTIHWFLNHVPTWFIVSIQRWLSSRIGQAADAVELGESFLPKR